MWLLLPCFALLSLVSASIHADYGLYLSSEELTEETLNSPYFGNKPSWLGAFVSVTTERQNEIKPADLTQSLWDKEASIENLKKIHFNYMK